MTTSTTHPTVGKTFKSFGAVYLCFRYERECGFWMRMLSGGDGLLRSREAGHEVCVSERAIGRTYHRRWRDETCHPHENPCECSVCEPRGER